MWAWASPLLVSTGVTASTHLSGLSVIATLMCFWVPRAACPARQGLFTPSFGLFPRFTCLRPSLPPLWGWFLWALGAAGLALSPPHPPTTRAFASAVPSAGNAIPRAMAWLLLRCQPQPLFSVWPDDCLEKAHRCSALLHLAPSVSILSWVSLCSSPACLLLRKSTPCWLGQGLACLPLPPQCLHSA